MKCFVTGATGFVGSHLCGQLAREGHDVFALARRGSNTEFLKSLDATIVEGDVHSTNIFARHAEKMDVVFHLAAITKTVHNRQFHEVNAGGTESLVRGLKRGNFGGRILLLSSLAAGGPAVSATSPRTEEDQDSPVSEYGRSKLEAEKILHRLLPDNTTATILRPGAIYGPREHEIYEVIRILNRTGTAVRFGSGVHTQMTHVADVVDAIIRAAFSPEAAGKTYYVNDEAVWSFEETISLIGESLGRDLRIVPLPMFLGVGLATVLDLAGRLRGKALSPLGRDKIHELRAGYWLSDSSRLRLELGWKPENNFPDGLRETVEWYRENGWL